VSRPWVAHVPDDLWKRFESGEIDHFEYNADHGATAVYADGYRQEFDTTVTKAMIDEERRLSKERCIAGGGQVYEFAFRATVDFESCRGIVRNSGE
jgi:hypothetical protein